MLPEVLNFLACMFYLFPNNCDRYIKYLKSWPTAFKYQPIFNSISHIFFFVWLTGGFVNTPESWVWFSRRWIFTRMFDWVLKILFLLKSSFPVNLNAVLLKIEDKENSLYTLRQSTSRSVEWNISMLSISCIPLGWSRSRFMIQDYLDQSASKEPWCSICIRIWWYFWCTTIQIFDHLFWLGSSKGMHLVKFSCLGLFN